MPNTAANNIISIAVILFIIDGGERWKVSGGGLK